MLLFRSEEHLGRWLGQRGVPRGGSLTMDQIWALARAWYADRLTYDWRRRTAEEAREVFERIGLTGAFWALP